MAVYAFPDRAPLAPLFAGCTDAIALAVLAGEGEAYGDDPVAPTCGQLIFGDFCLLGGRVADELAAHFPSRGADAHMIVVCPDADWEAAVLRAFGDRVSRHVRYAIKSEGDVFDRARLRRFAAALPDGFTLRRIGAQEYDRIMAQAWSRDLCSTFADRADYLARGLGYAAFEGEEPVAGASSYAVRPGAIEIEIDTRADLRHHGLATACGAALILACLERGLYPGWDAQNPISLALAEKLGYHFDREYTVFVIAGV